MFFKQSIAAVALAIIPCLSMAQLPQNTGGLYAPDTIPSADGSDLSIRVNPEIETVAAESGFGRVDYSPYTWLNLSANQINLNGADWCPLKQALDNAGIERVAIVHVGDSHIQADGATEVTRRLLRSRYGNGGRGFITPLKLAGTNEPLNYKFTSNSRFSTARLMKRPWAADMQFSGVAISPLGKRFDLTIDTETSRSLPDPFNVVRIFTSGAPVTVDSVASRGRTLPFGFSQSDGISEVRLAASADAITLFMSADSTTVISGVELLNGNSGLIYTAIGNNGAAFSSYDGLDLGRNIAIMNPALVVLSMGTNEAFGSITPSRFRESISILVDEIKTRCPSALILLVTPQECDKKVLSRRQKGRKRRSVFTANTRVKLMRDEILAYGKANHIPVYDYYAVAGGEGSTRKWVNASLFGRDHIHLNWTGYALMGQLLGDAIINAVENACSSSHPSD